MRARYPDTEGFIERGGVKVGYEVFGAGGSRRSCCSPHGRSHARQWKDQVPYLARRFRVITVEGRGNGRADRPASPAAYRDREYVDDAIAVLDATGVDQAVLVGLSVGGRHALQLAAWYPERAAGVVAIGAALPWPLPPDFDEPKDSYEGVGEGEPALLAGRLPRLGRVLHVAGVHRAALDQAAGGRGRLRAGDHRRDAAADGAGRGRAHGRGCRGHLPAGPVPGPGGAR